MSQSTNLQLPFLASGQAQKHVTVNESLLRLDALVQLSPASATAAAEPEAPEDGAIYILPAGKTGDAWGAMAEGALAYYRDGVWEEIAPREGWIGFVRDSDTIVVYDGETWNALESGGGMMGGHSLTPENLALSAQYRLIGRSASGPGAAQELASSADVFALLGCPNNAAILSAIGAARLAGGNAFSGHTRIVQHGWDVSDSALVLENQDEGSVGPSFIGYHNSASPTANDQLLRFRAYGRTSAAAIVEYCGFRFTVVSAANGAHSGAFLFDTVVAGVAAARMGIADGVIVGAPSGGYKGHGTLNAAAIYDDNVLLTCAPLHDDMTLADWNALVPRPIEDAGTAPRKHRTAQRHFDMLAEGYKPDDPRAFVARLRADKAVPGGLTLAEWKARMIDNGVVDKPSTAEYITRQQLQIDYLARALAALVDEIDAAPRLRS